MGTLMSYLGALLSFLCWWGKHVAIGIGWMKDDDEITEEIFR